MISVADKRDVAPIAFDGGFGQIRPSGDWMEDAARRGIAINGIVLPAAAVADRHHSVRPALGR